MSDGPCKDGCTCRHCGAEWNANEVVTDDQCCACPDLATALTRAETAEQKLADERLLGPPAELLRDLDLARARAETAERGRCAERDARVEAEERSTETERERDEARRLCERLTSAYCWGQQSAKPLSVEAKVTIARWRRELGR